MSAIGKSAKRRERQKLVDGRPAAFSPRWAATNLNERPLPRNGIEALDGSNGRYLPGAAMKLPARVEFVRKELNPVTVDCTDPF